MKQKWTALLCAAVMLAAALAGCADQEVPARSTEGNTQAQPDTPEAIPEPSGSVQEAEPPPETAGQVAGPVQLMAAAFRTGDWHTVQARSSALDAEQGKGYRVTQELCGALADILANGAATECSMEALRADWPAYGIALSVAPPEEEQAPYADLELCRYPDDYANGALAGKTVLLFPRAHEVPGFLYEGAVYDAVAALLEDAVYRYTDTLDGDYLPVSGGFFQPDAAMPYREVAGMLRLENRMAILWVLDNETLRSGLDVVDLETGLVVESAELEGRALALESATRPGFDCRVVFRDRAVYADSGTGARETYRLPADTASMAERTYDASEFVADFDIAPERNLLVFAGPEGVFRAAADGTGTELILSNSAIPALVAGNEMPDHEDSQLFYIAPMILGQGRYVAATMFMNGNGDYDGYSQGVSVIDLQTREARHLPGIFSWLSHPARRQGDAAFRVLGDQGVAVYDTETLEQVRSADVFTDLETVLDNDLEHWFRTERTRGEDGAVLSVLTTWPLDGGQGRGRQLLRCHGSRLRVDAADGGWALFSYGSVYEERSYALVPFAA